MTRLLTRSLLFVVLSLASMAVATEGQVAVQAEVVFASTKPGKVDPSLAKMQETLGQKVKYLTLEKRSSVKFTLPSKGVTSEHSLELPNKKMAWIGLESMKEGVATLRVKLAPTDATYSLAKDKSFYLQGGAHEGGDLWLVLAQPK
jgi:hypothetical protein